jgi:hypothetical protein
MLDFTFLLKIIKQKWTQMKKDLPFLAFALWPLVIFWDRQLNYQAGPQVQPLIVVWIAATFLVSILLFLALSRTRKFEGISAPIAGLAVALFFLKRFIEQVLPPSVLSWLLVFLFVVGLTFFVLKKYPKAIPLFRVFVSVLLLISVGNLVWNFKNKSGPVPRMESMAPVPTKHRNNVYYFILDGYTRNDFLKEYFGFDNKEFSQNLIEAGFYHAGKANANYETTEYSVPSLLGMDYIVKSDGKIEDWEKLDRKFKNIFYLRSIQDARVFSEFQKRGYELIYAHAYGRPVETLKFPIVGSKEAYSAEAMELVNLTPVSYFINSFGAKMSHRVLQNPVAVLNQAPKLDVPFFFFIHLYSPHSPYNQNADCSPRYDYSFNINPDDLDYVTKGTVDLYLDQIRCLNRNMALAIARILDQDPKAIIGIQSDHGWPSPLPKSVKTKDGVERKIRYGIQNWIRIPGVNKKWLYESLSPVNMFRLVFAHLDGNPEPAYLVDQSFDIFDGWSSRLDELSQNTSGGLDRPHRVQR